MKKNSRGFYIYGKIKDSYNSEITVQESSAAMKHCCWIFTHNDPIKFKDPSPHLTKAQAKKLIKALEKFINHD